MRCGRAGQTLARSVLRRGPGILGDATPPKGVLCSKGVLLDTFPVDNNHQTNDHPRQIHEGPGLA